MIWISGVPGPTAIFGCHPLSIPGSLTGATLVTNLGEVFLGRRSEWATRVEDPVLIEGGG
jgi:hypothetical protein